ncbi:MAG: hypothetical protein ACKO0M_06830 [Cyanobium sp.]
MNSVSAIEPQWLLLIALVMASVMLFLSADLSGWSGLARHYRATTNIEGERFRFATAQMGRAPHIGMSYKNCLCITVGASGIALSLWGGGLFRCPPLLLPWSAIESVREERHHLVRFTVIRLRGSRTRLMVAPPEGSRVAEACARFAVLS